MDDYVKNSKVDEQEIFVDAAAENMLDELFTWEVSHSIMENPTINCLLCGEVAHHTMAGVQVMTYTKGNGFLDKAGVRREMDLHTLRTNDPYAHMRPDGDREDLEKRINKRGYDAMNFRARMDSSFIKGIDETNIEAVQRIKRDYLTKKE